MSAYGTMLIVIIFFIMLSCTLSYLTSFSLKSQLPLTGMLIVLSLGFSAFDLNNNHDIRLLHTAGAPLPAAHAFTRWLDGRADFEAYKASGRQYPVFIVIAEGGGIYAANHAAMFLSRMQDICPNFAQHLFVISAVSGGSLGAGLFAALARDSATNAGPKPCASRWDQPGPVEVLSRKALDRDFLAPLVGAAVLPDFLQYFLPFPIESFDRAKTAEQSFEDMWAAISEEDHAMADDFLSLWEPDGAQPALLLNVTRVETGGRSEISHIDLGDGLFNNGLMFNQDSGQLLYSVRLSTAIGLSARFPWITPAGRLNPALPSNVVGFGTANFVDGGYYDNSGADAVLDLIEAIRYSLAYASVDLRVIVLKHLAPSENDAAGYDMFMPIRAMLNSRSERARSSVWRLVQTLCPTHDQCDHVSPLDQKVWYSYLEGDGYDLPLGWLFSTQSANAVSRIIGRPQDCPQDDYGNGCLIVHVRNVLQPPAAQ